MSKTKLVFVSEHLSSDDVLLSAFKEDVNVVVCSSETTLPDVASLSGYTHISFLYHFEPIAPFFVDGSEIELDTFSKTVVDFLRAVKSQNGSLVVDILTCDFNIPEVLEKVSAFETETGIDVRYSLDQTGNNPNGNWVLESDNVDVKDTYFTSAIDAWDKILSTQAPPPPDILAPEVPIIILPTIDYTAETTKLTDVGIDETHITSLKSIVVNDGAAVTENIVNKEWLLTKNKNERSIARAAALKIIFKKNSSISSFLTTPSESGLSGIITKPNVKVVKSGETIDLSNDVTETTGIYAPLEEEGDTVTFTLDGSTVTFTRAANDVINLTGDVTGTYSVGDKASILGYDMVFGSVAVNQPTGSAVGSIVVSNGVLTYTPDNTPINPSGLQYTYDETYNAYVATSGDYKYMVFKNVTIDNTDPDVPVVLSKIHSGRFTEYSQNYNDAIEVETFNINI